MTGDFIAGVIVGGMVGAALGVIFMAALVAASNADDVREGDSGRRSADVGLVADLDGDAGGVAGDGGTVTQ